MLDKDSASLTSSEATTLYDAPRPQQQQRTSLTGKPLKYTHDPFTNMISDSTDAGANHLPPGYTDSSLVRIPIKFSDIGGPLEGSSGGANASADGPDPVQPPQHRRRSSLFRKLMGQDAGGRSGGKSDAGGMVVVKMSRGDYLKYWAKGEDGRFVESVVEPRQGRRQWVIDQIGKARDW
ncbi:hypothetical protein K431DRAFT_287739 [Polychaeton citri CBS 116435]|uniref:Uncharacterized protein n=1 Tax=Polychaeton citri CBS 116435 TaxID=1314669 RepID=A0A9P4UMV5_9PEZI|nr:hypothetical protein K431DRAFT_287739 [Polychaeton citri CBS 116435]